MLHIAYRLGAQEAIKQAEIDPESYLGQAKKKIQEMVSPDEDPELLEKAVVGGAFAYPFVMSNIVNRVKPYPTTIPMVNTHDDLIKSIEPGDVLIMGSPRANEMNTMLTLGTGETDLQHGAIVTHKDHTGAPYITHIYKGPGLHNTKLDTDAVSAVRVLRAKDPAHRQKIIDRTHNILTELGSRGDKLEWSASRGVKSVLKDNLMPFSLQRYMSAPYERPVNPPAGSSTEELEKVVRKQLEYDAEFKGLSEADKIKKVKAICNTMVGVALPEAFTHKAPYDVMSRDIMASDAFDHIIEKRPLDSDILGHIKKYFKYKKPELSDEAIEVLAKNRFAREKLFLKLMAYGKPLTSLGVGAGLAGAAAIPFRIPKSDLSADEAVLSAGLIGGGLLPLAAPSIDKLVLKKTLDAMARTTDTGLKAKLLKRIQTGGLNLADTLKAAKIPGVLAATTGAGILAHNLIKDKAPERRPLF